MPIIETVNIHGIIFHRLSPATDLLLSAQEVPLSGPDDPLSIFFGAYIKNGLNDESARVAHFRAREGQTCTSCMAMLQNDDNFVRHSQLLAQKLFDIIAAYRGNISEGNLAFCLFSTEWNSEKHLAILKLDPSELVRPIPRTGPHGDYFILERQTDALPATSDKLQKCAFVAPPGSLAGFDMLVIDRQTTTGAEPARYFLVDFLEADPNYTDAYRTNRFYHVVREAHNKVRPILIGNEDELLTQARHSALSSQHINVDEWLRQLPVREVVKQQLLEKVQNDLQERNFDIDPSIAQRRGDRIVYRGTNGLRLQIQQSHLQNGEIRIVPEERDGQATGYTIITIRQRTDEWKEVSR